MIQDITTEKDDIKSNGIHVNGRNYTINFTGKIDNNVHYIGFTSDLDQPTL